MLISGLGASHSLRFYSHVFYNTRYLLDGTWVCKCVLYGKVHTCCQYNGSVGYRLMTGFARDNHEISVVILYYFNFTISENLCQHGSPLRKVGETRDAKLV